MTHKIHCHFEIQTDHLIPTRRPNLVTVNIKKNPCRLSNSGLCRPVGQQSENQRKRKGTQILRTCKRTKKLWNMRVTVIPVVDGAFWNVPKDLVKRLEELEFRRRIKNLHIWWHGHAYVKEKDSPAFKNASMQ